VSILEISGQIRRGGVSSVELTETCLQRIEKLNPVLNAFITVMADEARAQARQADAEIQAGKYRGPLHGIPIGLKDLVDTAGIRTTAASELFKDRVPDSDAEVVRRLKVAGAVLIGKQNLHEFAYGGSSLVSYFGDMHNPWDTRHITGGSSGGSAAAVSAELGYGAIGTDTAGSIREPAALCGVVGLKPTYGRVSAAGVVPLSLSLDHVGPITASVADAAIMLQAVAGFDKNDPSTVDVPVDDYVAAIGRDAGPLRIGVPRAFFYEDLDSEVSAAVEHALTVLARLIGNVKEIVLDVSTDRSLQSAESYKYHKYWVKESAQLYQPETLRRILAGEKVSEADYAERQRELEQTRHDIGKAFADCDVLVMPTMPMPAPAISDLKKDPTMLRPSEIRLLRNTRPINVWGLPAISVPCGFTNSGLPIGLQIVGRHWEESTVIALAHAYEQATAWHKRKPRLEELADEVPTIASAN
jgi:aspartyl-tRNA(Asn)/glutamyl-tRNA(Gln) amidotransferase subunit A